MRLRKEKLSMLQLVPTPKKIQINEEIKYILKCSIYTEEEKWEPFCKTFVDTFYKLHEVHLTVDRGGILLVREERLASGSYTIESGEETTGHGYIRVCAADDEGILYGLSSLIQLLGMKDWKIWIPKLQLEDYSDKDYRSLMVDLARLWHPFDKLLKYVDLCFLYKISASAFCGLYTLHTAIEGVSKADGFG